MPRKRAPNGNGTVRQRKDGRWEAIYSVGRDPGTGKLIRKSVYGGTSEEAARKLRAATAAIDENTYAEPEKMPLRQWLGVWLKEYTGSVKPGTVKTYESNVRLHITPALGAISLSDLRPHVVQTFINKLARTSSLAPKMVKNIHGTLHKALDTAVRVGYIRTNPADRPDLPRIERQEVQPLEGQQIDAFLAAVKGNQSEPLFFVAIYTGMRLSELLGLQWSCVDFKKGAIKIDKQLLIKRGKDTTRAFGTPKNGKARTIKPAPAVMDRLNAVRLAQSEARLKAGEMWRNGMNLVFTDAIGDAIPHATVEHRFKRIVTGIGLPDRRFHDLRHTYATEGIRLGIPIKTISESLGHYSAAFTMDVYGHVTEEMQDNAAALVQAAILGRNPDHSSDHNSGG